jgi:hypothetical protein
VIVQDNVEQRFMHRDASVVFDEAQFNESDS